MKISSCQLYKISINKQKESIKKLPFRVSKARVIDSSCDHYNFLLGIVTENGTWCFEV